MNARLQRIAYEVALAAARYSQTKSADYDDEDGSWVVIKDFPLPPGYNYEQTDVLILLPPNYPQTPPDWFYVDDNLRLADGKKPSHVFYNETRFDPNRARRAIDAPPQMKGWTACCLHIHSWKPAANPLEGHSLLSVCELIRGALKRWRGNPRDFVVVPVEEPDDFEDNEDPFA
ncbi:MAG: E2/UBC family protein [Fimbriimonadales bacterium]